MKTKRFFKQFITFLTISAILTGCAARNSQEETPANSDDSQISKTGQGALIGGFLGALIGAATGKGSKGKRVLLGGALGAAIGGGIGYSMDQQAKEIADELETDVNNTPQAVINPDNDLVVSNTEKYVKIMLRDSMVFKTNSSIPTQEASKKIAKISKVLQKYPNTLIQVVGFTDSRGSYEYNQKLSEQRASNVGNTLYNSGIENKIFSKGCSYNKPLIPNKTKENMALNRRVEIYLYSNKTDVIDPCTAQ
jgi:outer membrane protein OmpA-like peptidoglycan-associated protein